MDGDHGDARLAERLRALTGGRFPVAGALLGPEGAVTASVGAGLGADYEIGSVSKGVTGLLYADALERGEVTAGTALGALLPLADVPVGSVTLGTLATHRSGLPRIPAAARPWRRTFALWRHGANPYGEDVAELLDQARTVRPGSARPRYSNLGFELLGHALAAAAGTSYEELVAARIGRPLGLDRFYLPATAADLRPGALEGTTRRGGRREPWTGEALGPAGGIRADIGSMARFTAALLDGTAPGTAALDPVAPFSGGTRIGAAWITLRVRSLAITMHNGGTGGFRSWLGLDREAGTGVVVLAAASVSVDRPGFALLTEGRPRT
ncbi:serine hydrolase domain-containing protein [Streptomyces omiyaensis]|uniref:serine hydrolase domain-containing protein n=1 Tax=Streptomyces omiyaensis TaxID=68247 RepID=UPI0016759616|nr:serine hydrolase domain-containing protein [Streptomyces omiyaensis]